MLLKHLLCCEIILCRSVSFLLVLGNNRPGDPNYYFQPTLQLLFLNLQRKLCLFFWHFLDLQFSSQLERTKRHTGYRQFSFLTSKIHQLLKNP